VALAEFNSTFTLQLDFSSNQAEILKHAQRINYTAGNTSLVVGINGAIKEIESYPRRQNSRLVLLVISDGNSQDDWTHIQKTAKKLRQLNKTEVYAATLSNAYYFDELREYTEDEKHIYADEKVENFIQVTLY
jgi:Mg-chelatase subunit ChlD